MTEVKAQMPRTLKAWMKWYWAQLWTWHSLLDLVILLAVGWIGTRYHISLWIQYPAVLTLWLLACFALQVAELLAEDLKTLLAYLFNLDDIPARPKELSVISDTKWWRNADWIEVAVLGSQEQADAEVLRQTRAFRAVMVRRLIGNRFSVMVLVVAGG